MSALRSRSAHKNASRLHVGTGTNPRNERYIRALEHWTGRMCSDSSVSTCDAMGGCHKAQVWSQTVQHKPHSRCLFLLSHHSCQHRVITNKLENHKCEHKKIIRMITPFTSDDTRSIVITSPRYQINNNAIVVSKHIIYFE